MSIPEVIDCIRIDSELHVQFFSTGGACPITPMVLPRDCRFSCKSMLKNAPAYLQSRKELHSSVFEEIHEHRFFLKRIYSANIIWCALLLSNISVQSSKMLLEHFPLPSLSLLSKFIQRKLVAIKYAQYLKEDDEISEDICLLFDEMYLQKC